MAGDRHRLVLLVAQDFGVQILEGLDAGGHVDKLVVSYDDAYDAYYGYRSSLAYCRSHGIPALDYSQEKEASYDRVAAFAPSHIICGYFARILPDSVLGLAAGGAFNVHPGDLPRYRGPFPTAWAILNGETEIVVTVHEMDAGIDTGDVLFQSRHQILPNETGFELYRRSMTLAADLYLQNMDSLLEGRFAATKQVGYGSYYGVLPAATRIDWRLPCARIAREARVHAPPYLPAHTLVKNRMVLINKCSVVEIDTQIAQGPGRVLKVHPDGSFLVSGVDGCLLVSDYEVVPGERMGASFPHIRSGIKLG